MYVYLLGNDLITQLANTNVEELNVQELENMTPSPFTEVEQKWCDRIETNINGIK